MSSEQEGLGFALPAGKKEGGGLVAEQTQPGLTHLAMLPCKDPLLLLLPELTRCLLPGGEGGGWRRHPQPLPALRHTAGHRAAVRGPCPGPRCCPERCGGQGWARTGSGSRVKTEVLLGKRKEGQREAEKRPSPDAFR